MSSPAYNNAMAPAPRGANLADVLERVLDKGLVVAGDIRINLLDIELLTIKIRLLLVSADKAEELGMSWWRTDPFFAGTEQQQAHGGDQAELQQRLEQLESRLQALSSGNGAGAEARQEQEQSRSE